MAYHRRTMQGRGRHGRTPAKTPETFYDARCPTHKPQGSEQTRAIADQDARRFRCKKDKAKHYGN
jgi:hypothetical protein